jgi:hypothetical protein
VGKALVGDGATQYPHSPGQGSSFCLSTVPQKPSSLVRDRRAPATAHNGSGSSRPLVEGAKNETLKRVPSTEIFNEAERLAMAFRLTKFAPSPTRSREIFPVAPFAVDLFESSTRDQWYPDCLPRRNCFLESRLTRHQSPAPSLASTVKDLQAAGFESLRAIASALEERGIPTARGGKWSSVQVSRLLEAASALSQTQTSPARETDVTVALTLRHTGLSRC